jgi:hypothetical protein
MRRAFLLGLRRQLVLETDRPAAWEEPELFSAEVRAAFSSLR